MKIVLQCALAGVLSSVLSACANPVDVAGCAQGAVTTNCDVILAAPSEFGADASVGQGGNSDSLPLLPQAGASGGGNPAGGSAGSLGQAGAGSGAAGTPGAAGASGTAGAQGTAGTTAAGGAAGSAQGTAGTTVGTAGTTAGSGTGGTAGTGGPLFDPEACDFTDQTGCEALACATACPAGMGNYCTDNCPLIIACVQGDPSCITEQDPMCGVPFQNPYAENTCTQQVNNSGGPDPTDPNTPAYVARAFIECLCSVPRPGQ